MNKRMTFSEVKAIEFTLDVGDIFQMLKAKGEIPEGFVLDCDNPEATDWPIRLHIKRCVEVYDPAFAGSAGSKP